MPELYEHIGNRIRELRGSLSQEVLAKKLEIAPNTVSRWETGTYKPTAEDLDNLARFFKVPITTFFPDLGADSGRVQALTSAIGGLGDKDFEEVVRYAEFRRARLVLEKAKGNKGKRKTA
jgi:transcriptional regulator with XRE-family HTH domain